MNYVPPTDPGLEIEAARQRERELEIKAEAYARRHEDDDGGQGPAGAIRRALDRVRAAIRRG